MTEETQAPEETVVEDRAEEMASDVVENVEAEDVENVEAEDVEAEDVDTEVISKEEFNKLYFQLKQAERERDAALNQKVEPVNTANQAQPAAQEPTLEQFDFDEAAYTAALVDYKVEQKLNAALENQSKTAKMTQEQQRQQEITQNFNNRAVEYAAQNPGYEKAIEMGASIIYPPHVQAALLSSEHGPQLDHMLLTNPQKVQELSTMPQYQALMELGKMEASINKAPAPKAVKVTQAPEPIEDVAGGGGASTKSIEDMTMEEFAAYDKAQKLARLSNK